MKNILIKGIGNYDDVAMNELNATHSRIYFLKQHDYLRGWVAVPFSVHYFNADDLEIAYYICDTVYLLGLIVLDNPRVWSDELKMHPNYGKPVDIKTSITVQYECVGRDKPYIHPKYLR